MFCNFNVFAISTFPKSLECSNFHAVAISTFSDLQGVCNFNGLQFPHARGARKRKIVHLVCLYKAETTSSPPQSRKNQTQSASSKGEMLRISAPQGGFSCNFNTRAKRASGKFDNNFDVLTIFTFCQMWFRCNFHGSTISTFVISGRDDNFHRKQFQYRFWRIGSPKRSQFQRPCNFDSILAGIVA